MANTTGKKFGGRKKGTPNKNTQQVVDLLDKLGCNPIEGMVKIATGEAKCLSCVDGKVTVPQFFRMSRMAIPSQYKDKDANEINEMITSCPTCGGSGVQPIEPTLAGKMYSELAQYVAPKRKSVELSVENAHETAIKAKIDEVKNAKKARKKTTRKPK